MRSGRLVCGALAFFFFAEADAFFDGCGENGFAAKYAAGAAGHAVGFEPQAMFLVGTKMRTGKAHRRKISFAR
jgi:hypothetical protein